MVMNLPEPVAAALRPSERVVWLGRPDPVRYGWRRGRYWFLAGILLVPFALHGEYMALTAYQHLPDQQPMLIAMLLAGLAMLMQPFWHQLDAKRTSYVITDRRVLIFSGIVEKRMASFAPPFEISVRESGDGSGTISFPQEFSSHGGVETFTRAVELVAVPDVAEVQRHIEGMSNPPAREPADTGTLAAG